ncbi:hypothetical protein [Chryseobacterium lathyri]|uniref:Uncharacterized protein n=1 Tax=Chryseobacterium lathyri TaxID=395933 RepID=A0ABT9SS05_9FLAO|nr:hypothetical protein [Chryseobacterium lathyri]MDP9961752.1 hypothetical protein [Chryseobacterium lathyri]
MVKHKAILTSLNTFGKHKDLIDLLKKENQRLEKELKKHKK